MGAWLNEASREPLFIVGSIVWILAWLGVGDRFVVRPFFPFNLFFLPEIYGLEHDIAISRVVRAELGRFLFWKKLVVTFRDDRGERSLTLFLQHPEKLAELFTRGTVARA